jgi:branched-chain amino acid transport system substrate-binding protein
VLVSFDEGSRILRTAVESGIGPKVKKWYGTDGNMGNALGENFDSGK